MNDILVAYEGHVEKLKIIHGSGKEENGGKATVTSVDDFDRMFG